MLSQDQALERAYIYWRITGISVHVDGIQRQQLTNGYEPCFGRGHMCEAGHRGPADQCRFEDCQWHHLCMQLLETPLVGEALWLCLQSEDL